MNSSRNASVCRLCAGECLPGILDFGPQPICNRFLQSPTSVQETFPLALSYCPVCAVPQVVQAVPASAVRPRYEWITYREAEAHLDDMVDRVMNVQPLAADAVIGGLTYKDTTTLDRFRREGFASVWQLSPHRDLGCEGDHVEMETVQDLLTPVRAEAIASRRGRCDVLIARHILEHAHDPRRFFSAISALLTPQGLVVFEVPDFGRCITGLDYAPVWEEHILYFNCQTLPTAVERGGFAVVQAYEHPYSLENAVICLSRRQGRSSAGAHGAVSRDQQEREWQRYASSFAGTRHRVQRRLCELRERHGRIALYGAGHLSCKFVNLYGIGDVLSFVVDDDPHKKGLYMAGSRVPIMSSSELARQAIKLCLLGLSPDSEQRVHKAQQGFIDDGGIFMSIFPSNPSCFLHE